MGETLTDFLLARIAKDEAVAQAAAHDGYGAIDWAGESGPTDVHIARHDPARVLAECEAKRRIAIRRATAAYHVEQFAGAPPDDPFRLLYTTSLSTYDAVLRSLVMPYADHPSYRDEWRL